MAIGTVRRAFTLIEIMVVVAVMGIILVAGAPTLFKMLHREGFRKTVNDFRDVCTAARARAILQGVPTTVVFHPRAGKCEVRGGSASGQTGGLATTAQLDKSTRLDGLFIDGDGENYAQEEEVTVRFFPEGTCDEMLLVLTSERHEQRALQLEVTTGFVRVLNEAQIQDLARGRL